MQLSKRPKKVKFRKEPKRPRLRMRKRKVFEHSIEMKLEDLHEQETYSFFLAGRAGYSLKTVPGYRFIHNWQSYDKAFEPESRILPTPQPGWIKVRLPNKRKIMVQPESWAADVVESN